jgi:hypothetical protein
MATPYVQRGGIVTFGNSATPSATFSTEVANVSFKVSRPTTEKMPTYGDTSITQVAGGVAREVTIEYLGDPSNLTSFWAQMKTAIDSNTGELYGTVQYETGARSTTNKRYVFTCLVTELMIGAKVNEIWGSSVTFPVTAYAEQTS